jgi:phosphatidylserine/phosphatidylglycerophosphate/cardiolipin synthase-like enzyme
MNSQLLALALSLLIFPALALDFEQHFAPGENLEKLDVQLIDTAGETIDMAAYVLTDVAVIEALTLAAERGVRVRIYRQAEEYPAYGDVAAALTALKAAGVEMRFKTASAPLMHLKAYCIDGQVLRIGAANFSASGLKRQDNDLEIHRGLDACDKFETKFSEMWSAQ